MGSSMIGKSVLVTGASKGIGKGIARAFACHGAQVAVVARTIEEARVCATEFQLAGWTAHGFQGDVRDGEGMQQLAYEVATTFGGIDVLCANAGTFPSVSLEEMTVQDWDHVLNTNARGTLFALQACLPYLKRAEYGRVVITSSITGPVTGYKGWAHYGASKSAQLGLMRSAALELAVHGITINAVLPGNILTEGITMMGDEYIRSMTASIPLGRMGHVDDVGSAALFLASREAGFITGQTLVVDGGQILPEGLDSAG